MAIVLEPARSGVPKRSADLLFAGHQMLLNARRNHENNEIIQALLARAARRQDASAIFLKIGRAGEDKPLNYSTSPGIATGAS